MSEELIARLREQNCPSQWHDDIADCNEERREAADALERAERVVAAMRDIRETCAVNAREELWSSGAASVLYMLGIIWAKAEGALRGDTTRADTVREWETFIAADGQPAIRRKNQHLAGLNAEEEKK